MVTINFMAVIVAGIVTFILGFLFHGPISGKLWMRLANIHPTGNEKFSDMVPQMLWNLLVNFVTAFVFALIYTSSSFIGNSVSNGVMLAIWVWLGFLVTSSSIEVIWMGKNYKLWLFEAGCSLVSMIAMGAIIANW